MMLQAAATLTLLWSWWWWWWWWLCLLSAHTVQALPDGFVKELVGPPASITKAVTGAFLPNLRRSDHRPMMLVLSKHGHVRVVENPENREEENDDGYVNLEDLLPSNRDSNLVLDLSGEGKLCTNGERGLTSIAIHPDFLQTRWVYLYYTRWSQGCFDEGPQNVLVRYTMNSTTLILENEELLLELGVLGGRVHNGGGMEFGTDGNLYLATGDGGLPHASQNRSNLHGSLLRLNDDGSVPRDNPYAKQGVPCGKSNETSSSREQKPEALCSEIFAWGFRNPIRMALNTAQSNTERALFAISDVGAQNYEELSWAGTDYPLTNYGWPQMEGPCVAHSADNCPPPPPTSLILVDPFHFYAHRSTQRNEGGCVTGSTFVPEGIWPKSYNYLFIDFVFSAIYSLQEDPDAECRGAKCLPPSSGYINSTFYETTDQESEQGIEARMVDMFFGPYRGTQALYVIQYGNDDSIFRIRYAGFPPVAAIRIGEEESTKPIVVGQGQAFTLDGSGSFDPDGDELAFAWDFGDGTNDKRNTVAPSHAYEVPGDYNVTLTVSDPSDNTNHASVAVKVVGTSLLTVEILSPAEGELFSWGQVLHLQGQAFDHKGDSIPDTTLVWNVRLHHADGTVDSVVNQTIGNDLYLDPSAEVPWINNFATKIGYLSVTLVASDKDGHKAEIARELRPNVAAVALATQPDGLFLVVDGVGVAAPHTVESWVNVDLPLRVPPEQPPYQFQKWSDGYTDPSRTLSIPQWKGGIATTRQVNNSVVSVTAVFCLGINASCGNHGSDEEMFTDCCSGYCNPNGFCQEPQIGSTSMATPYPTKEAPTAYPTALRNSPEKVTFPVAGAAAEPDRKLTPPNPIVENTELDEMSRYTDSDESETTGNNVDRLGPLGITLVIVVALWMVLVPAYLAYKYLQLKIKMEAEAKRSGSSRSFEEPDVVVASPMGLTVSDDDVTEGVFPFVEPITSCVSSLSSAGSSIWEKLAIETERRAQLRKKYSISSTGTPLTPETLETKASRSTTDSATSRGVDGSPLDSPAVITDDDSASSTVHCVDTNPSAALTTDIEEMLVELDEDSESDASDIIAKSSRSTLTSDIDDTLVRLDNLLSKTLTSDISYVPSDKNSAAGTIDSVASDQVVARTAYRNKTLVPSDNDSASGTSNSIATSRSAALTNNIDETLVRLDDLLSKTFSKRLPRSGRKKEQSLERENIISEEESLERGDASAAETTVADLSQDESNLAPLWQSTGHTAIPDSPLRDDSSKKSDFGTNSTISTALLYELYELDADNKSTAVIPESLMQEDTTTSPALKENNAISSALLFELEATNASAASLYGLESSNASTASVYGFQGETSNVSNVSQILKLSQFSDNSLLVFQDQDASCATSEGIRSESEDRMESGLLGDWDQDEDGTTETNT